MKTITNCRLIKLSVKQGLGYPDIKNNKCNGYAASEDEPCEECKKCKHNDVKGEMI